MPTDSKRVIQFVQMSGRPVSYTENFNPGEEAKGFGGGYTIGYDRNPTVPVNVKRGIHAMFPGEELGKKVFVAAVQYGVGYDRMVFVSEDIMDRIDADPKLQERFHSILADANKEMRKANAVGKA